MKAKCHCWQGKMGAVTLDEAVTNGLGPIKAGRDNLSKNSENVGWTNKLQTTPGQK
jgi:hypothetical protein